MADTTTDTTEPRPPLDYEQAKQILEAEIQRLQAFQEIQSALRDMQAWLNGDDASNSKEAADGTATATHDA